MLEKIKKKVRCIPNYHGLYTYLVGANGPIIVDNKGNVLEYMISMGDLLLSIYFYYLNM